MITIFIINNILNFIIIIVIAIIIIIIMIMCMGLFTVWQGSGPWGGVPGRGPFYSPGYDLGSSKMFVFLFYRIASAAERDRTCPPDWGGG
jgi:hypothetical protein